MAKRRPIQPKKRYFVGCEGESEQGYATFLQILAKQAGLDIYLELRKLSKAGSPLILAKQANFHIVNGQKGGKPKYRARFLLLDTDTLGQIPANDGEMWRLAEENDITLVLQRTCFEATLLRHFPGHENRQPHSSAAALQQLQRIWPEYRKGMAGKDLATRIGIDDVRRATSQPIQQELRQMLQILGLL